MANYNDEIGFLFTQTKKRDSQNQTKNSYTHSMVELQLVYSWSCLQLSQTLVWNQGQTIPDTLSTHKSVKIKENSFNFTVSTPVNPFP